MRSSLQSFALHGLLGQKRYRKLTVRERQQLAVSYAFQSTLLSNPNVTIEMVRRVAER